MEESEGEEQDVKHEPGAVMPNITPDMISMIAEEVRKLLNAGSGRRRKRGRSDEDPQDRAIMLVNSYFI
jgi:hypothetical protein